MEQPGKQTISELETMLVALHRREMRLRPVVSSPVVSVENRNDAREALEAILNETRVVEDAVTQLEAER